MKPYNVSTMPLADYNNSDFFWRGIVDAGCKGHYIHNDRDNVPTVYYVIVQLD